MKKYLTEFIGTFFLVLTIGLAVAHAGDLAPLAIGSGLMVMVYMGGHVSGAQYNPAVALAVLLAGKQGVGQFVGFVVTQLVAAVVATLAADYLTGKQLVVAPGSGVDFGRALLGEVLFTFALAVVVLNVACARKTQGNSFYGLAIGFTVATGAFAVGSVSGGAFNPAVGIGPNLVRGRYDDLVLYSLGPVLGALIAALVFRIQEAGE
jgi:aquaporin Z